MTEANRLPDVFEGFSAAVFLVDPDDATILDANEAACEQLQYDRDQLVGLTVDQFSASFPEEMTWENHVEQLRQNGNASVYTHHIDSRGERLPVVVNVEYAEYEGQPRIIAKVKCTSGSGQTPPTIYASQSRYQSVFEHAPIGLWEQDWSDVKERVDRLREQGVEDLEDYLSDEDRLLSMACRIDVVSVNRETLQLYGAENKQELIDHFENTIIPNFPGILRDQIVDFAQGRREWTRTISTVRLDGEKIRVRIKLLVPPAHSEDLKQVFVAVEDVTEQFETRRRLQQRETYLSALVDNIPGITYRSEYDEQWTMRFISERVEEVTGYPAEALIDNQERSYASIIHPEDRELVQEIVREAVERGDSYDLEYRIRRPDGEVRWVEERGQAEYENGGSEHEVKHLHGIILDQTERIEAQHALERREQSLRDFYRITTNRSMDFTERIQEVLKHGCQQFGFDTALYNRLTEDGLRIETAVGSHAEELSGDVIELGEAYCRETIENEELNVIHDALNEGWEDDPAFAETPFRSYVGSPLIVGGEIYGTVCFENEDPCDATVRSGLRNYVRVIAHWLGYEIERRRIERDLEESERRFRQMAENFDDVFYNYLPDYSEVKYISPAYEDVWERPLDEAYEDPWAFAEAIHPDDRERVLSRKQRLIDKGLEEDTLLEYRIETPGGEVKWIQDEMFGVREDGELRRIVGYAKDVTERKQAQQERDKLFEITPDMIGIADQEGHFLDVNPAFTEVLGYGERELKESSYLDFVHPEDRHKTRQKMAQLQRGESVEEFENRYRTSNGEIRWLQWNAIPTEDRVFAVCRDVTEQREYRQRLERALEEKQVLLEEVHHRVKNNLQVVTSLLDMQSRDIESEESREAFRDSVSRIRTMALIHEKLYESESLNEVNVEEYLEELVEFLREVAPLESLAVEFSVEPISLSPGQSISLGMLVNELVTNAAQHGYGEEKSGTITIQFHSIADNRGRLVVADDGRGLADDVDPDSATSMGMRVVRSLVNYDLDGEFDFETGDGTTITVEFPLESGGVDLSDH